MTTDPDPLVRADDRSRAGPPDVPGAVPTLLADALGIDPDRADGRLRRVPSAGALHPVAVYLDRHSGGHAETIRWHPHGACVPVHHRATDRDDGIDVVFVTKPKATIAKYGDHALMHIVLDVGYARSAVVHSATAHQIHHGPAEAISLQGVSGFPLAAISVDPDAPASAVAPPGNHDAPSPPIPSSTAPTDIVTQALGQLAQSPHTATSATTTIPLSAIRSRRSQPYDLLTRAVAPETIAALLLETSPHGWPDDVGVWLSTATDLRRWTGEGFALVSSGDLRGRLAEDAAAQHALADAGALVLFTALPAVAVPAAAFLHHRLCIAHLGYGLCVRATGRSLGARPVGGWTTTSARFRPVDDGVIVHGVALGSMPGAHAAEVPE